MVIRLVQRKLRAALAEIAESLPDGDPLDLQEIRAIRLLVEQVRCLELETVRAARAHQGTTATGKPRRPSGPRTWSEIGEAAGMTRQSAHERWAKEVAGTSEATTRLPGNTSGRTR